MWRYQPPGSVAGSIIAKIAQIYTSSTLKEELYRMKQILEAGEIATIEGQPSGREEIQPVEMLSPNVEPEQPAPMVRDDKEPQPTLH
jgi:hypothetical protein